MQTSRFYRFNPVNYPVENYPSVLRKASNFDIPQFMVVHEGQIDRNGMEHVLGYVLNENLSTKGMDGQESIG